MAMYMRWLRRGNLALGACALVLLAVGIVLVSSQTSPAAEPETSEEVRRLPVEAYGWAFMSAAIAVGLSCIAGGLAVGMSNTAAMGAIAERPELMGRALLFVGLAEGIAIYGLVVGILILSKVG